jgi:hypothetical protein
LKACATHKDENEIMSQFGCDRWTMRLWPQH